MLHTSFKKILLILSGGAVLAFLHYVFSGQIILPQIFSLGPFTTRYYGLIMALAVASGFYLAKKRAGEYGIDSKLADDLIFWIIVGGFIGARLYHILSSIGYYQNHLIDTFKVWNGGLSIYGAVLGGLSVILLLATSYHLQITRLLNWLTPSLILGQIIGRFGNLFNYEAYGYPTNLPWRIFVPEAFRPGAFSGFNFFHPWFLYEQLGLLAIFFILRTKRKSGESNLFLAYVLLYNILRFALEFLRIDSVLWQGFRQNAAVSLLLSLLAAVLICGRSLRTAEKKYVSTP